MLQSTQDPNPSTHVRPIRPGKIGGDPQNDIFFEHGGAGGRHTDDRLWLAVQGKGLSDDRWIAAKTPLPETIAEHNHLLILERECPSESRLNTQE